MVGLLLTKLLTYCPEGAQVEQGLGHVLGCQTVDNPALWASHKTDNSKYQKQC